MDGKCLATIMEDLLNEFFQEDHSNVTIKQIGPNLGLSAALSLSVSNRLRHSLWLVFGSTQVPR